MKLRHVLVTVIIILVTAPLLTSLLYIRNQVFETYQSHFEEKLKVISSIQKKHILDSLGRVQDVTSLVAGNSRLKHMIRSWEFYQYQSAKLQIDKIITEMDDEVNLIQEVCVYDANRNLVAATWSGAPALIPDKQFPFIDNGIQIHFHDPSQAVLQSAVKLQDENGLVGYLVLHFSLQFMFDLVYDKSGLGKTGEWLFAIRKENGDALFAVPLKYDPNGAFVRTIPKERTDVPITQALLGNETIMRHAPDYIETPVMASTRYIEELDWGVVAKVNESEIKKELMLLDWIMLAVAIPAVLISVLVAIGVSRFIAYPIEKLRVNTGRLAKGEYRVESVNSGWLEAKELSDSFVEMAQSIKDLNDNLSAKVVERTKELNEANKKLVHLATMDPLTGLYNRRYMNEELSREFELAKLKKIGLACVMMDIDHFKRVNDTWGHDIGDEVLEGLAKYLCKAVRTTDTVGRVGGEEFCLLMPVNEDQEAILDRLETIRSKIEELSFSPPDLKITSSFGVAFYNPGVARESDLLKQADRALYQAKVSGRNRIELFREKVS